MTPHSSKPQVQGSGLENVWLCPVHHGERYRSGRCGRSGCQRELVAMVPREVAERLAEALKALVRDIEDFGSPRTHVLHVEAADRALAMFRAVFPKADERMRESNRA